MALLQLPAGKATAMASDPPSPSPGGPVRPQSLSQPLRTLGQHRDGDLGRSPRSDVEADRRMDARNILGRDPPPPPRDRLAWVRFDREAEVEHSDPSAARIAGSSSFGSWVASPRRARIEPICPSASSGHSSTISNSGTRAAAPKAGARVDHRHVMARDPRHGTSACAIMHRAHDHHPQGRVVT